MCEPIENAAFDVLDVSKDDAWTLLKTAFHQDNESVMRSTRELIDASFQKLKSSEAAFELLRSFQFIQSRGAIQKQILSKATDVLAQFSKEIDLARNVFEVHRNQPPLSRNQPPIAGSIRWSRSLFGRIKQTMDKMTCFHADLKNDAMGLPFHKSRSLQSVLFLGLEVNQKYLSFARTIMLYEKEKVKHWASKADAICLSLLKQPILKKREDGEVVVNFDDALQVMIKEIQGLDKMGIEVPEVAMNVALQGPHFQKCLEDLNRVLIDFRQARPSCAFFSKQDV